MDVLLQFPVESVPDGHAGAPHHFYIGLGVIAIVALYYWDYWTDREPRMVVIGLSIALFSFASVWPFYSVSGALGSIIGSAIATVGVLRFRQYLDVDSWRDAVTHRGYAAALLGVVILWDDVISHSLFPETPIDYFVWDLLLSQVVA